MVQAIMNHQRVLSQLRELRFVEMKPTGDWGLTQAGRDFIDQIDLLRFIDERSGAPRSLSPVGGRAQTGERTGAAAPGRRARRGDDDSTRPEAQKEGTT